MTTTIGRIRLLLIGLFALAGTVHAESTYDIRRTSLDNGLTVLSLEDHSCPIVAVQVWYKVGSKDENPERQGFAHMFEHMMFRGTDRLGPESHFEYIRRTGGNCNAYTSFDNTTYVNKLPSNQLELALWLEAERMAFLKIDDESFHTERAVVEEERRVSSLNRPYGTVPEKLLGDLFRKHPYHWTPIGQIPHLRAASIDELQKFWDTYYVPSNAVLVVVGDVKHEDVQRLAKKYFAWIPTCPNPPRITEMEPPQAEPRKLTIPEKKGPAPLVGLVYRGVPVQHPDALPLEMLMQVLGGGESSRMYKDIVKERKIAQVALAGAFGFEQDGLAAAGAILMPWGNKQATIKALREHVERVRQEGVTDHELEKVRNQYLRDYVTQSLTIEAKASLLGDYELFRGGAENINKRLDEIRGVTVADVQRVAKAYLIPERETEVVVQPEFGSMIKGLFGLGKEDDVDEGAAPVEKPTENRIAERGGPRATAQRPDWWPSEPPSAELLAAVPQIEHQEHKLSNGLKVVTVPNQEVPFVTMTLGLLNGAWTEDKPGTATLAAGMVTKGSAHHTAAEMAEELEFNAISLGGSASMDVASVNASCVTDKFDLAMKLLAEVVRTPTFPADEFEILRSQMMVGMMVQEKTPEYIADRELRQRLFGGHPYSRTAEGEMKDVQALDIDQLKAWWSKYVRPDTAVLYVAGDVTQQAAVAAAEKYFADWSAEGDKPAPQVAALPEKNKTHIYLVDRPGSVQSQIRVGQLGVTRKDPEYFTTRTLSQIFGGAFNSRLNKAIRVEKGLTYGARGGFGASRFAGTFNIGTFTKTPSTAETLNVILDEIDKIRATDPQTQELDDAKNYMIGSFAGDRETPQAIVGDLWLIEYADLPKDYLDQFLSNVRQTTAEGVRETAYKLIDQEHLTIVVVGEADKVKADLEKIAPVTVVKAEETQVQAPEGTETP